jgi:hypothetical protein
MDRYSEQLEQDVRDAVGGDDMPSLGRSHDRLYKDDDGRKESSEALYKRTSEPIQHLDDDELRQRYHDQKLRLEDDREPAEVEDVEARYARLYPSHVKDGKYVPPTDEAAWEYSAAQAYAQEAETAQHRQDEAAFPDHTPEVVSRMYGFEQGLRDPGSRAETLIALAQTKQIDLGRCYGDVMAIAQAVDGLTPEAQRLALHRLLSESGMFAFMAKAAAIPAAIGKAERRLLGFDMSKAADKISRGDAVDLGDPELQLEFAHLMSRKKSGSGKSVYEANLEADVRRALDAEGSRQRDELGRFVARDRPGTSHVDSVEQSARDAFDDVAAKRGRPTVEALRKIAKESGTTLADAMGRYHSFDAVLSHPDLGTAGLVHAWVNSGGSLADLAHVLHAAGGAEIALHQRHQAMSRQRLAGALTAPQSGPTAADYQRAEAARAMAASRSISGSAYGYSDGGSRRAYRTSAEELRRPQGRHDADIEDAVRRAYARAYGGDL